MNLHRGRHRRACDVQAAAITLGQSWEKGRNYQRNEFQVTTNKQLQRALRLTRFFRLHNLKNLMQALPRVATVFSEVLGIPIESVGDKTSPENTPQWDSLNAMNLVVALEGAFNIRFSTKEIVSMRTVGIVRKVLRTKGIDDA